MKNPLTFWLERREAAAVERGRLAAFSEVAKAMRGTFQPQAPVQAANPVLSSYQLNPVAPNQYPQTGGSPFPLYGYDNPIWYATPYSPKRRPDTLVTTDLIRQFADRYDILRSCINHLKREVEAQPFDIVPRDPHAPKSGIQARVMEAGQFFGRAGGLGLPTESRRHFESKIFEDLLVLGCWAVWKGWSLGGRLQEMLAIDAATFRPRMDAYGWPGPEDVWYEQWIMGMKIRDFEATGLNPSEAYKVGGFGRDEIVYDGLWPMTWTPWFRSPVEYLITTVMAALASDKWNRQWLTTGDTPSDVFFLPPEWTPEEIETFALYFNQMLSGNTEKRRQTKFLPGVLANKQSSGRKDQDFEKFDLWLARRTAAIMGVQLSSIGFAGEQYKVSQVESNDLTSRLGTVSLLAMRKELYDSVLSDLGFGDLEIQDRVGPEESKTDLAARLLTSTQVAHKTVNEARLEDGLPPVPGGDVVLVPSAGGVAPLSAVASLDSDGLDEAALDVDDAESPDGRPGPTVTERE